MTRPAVTTAVDAVTAHLRDRILAGELAPGARLPEQALCAEYDVARHTVRAALRALSASRLVVVEPHRGARVAALDRAGLQALFELRAALEVEAARLLAERAGFDPWPREVADAAEALQRACSEAGGIAGGDGAGGDRAAVDAAHAALHHALVAAAGSPRIAQAHAALEVESRVVLLQSRPALPPRRMADLHAALLDDLRRDGPEALRRHLREGARAVAVAGAEGQDGGQDGAHDGGEDGGQESGRRD